MIAIPANVRCVGHQLGALPGSNICSLRNDCARFQLAQGAAAWRAYHLCETGRHEYFISAEKNPPAMT